jgi:hypothetical protein
VHDYIGHSTHVGIPRESPDVNLLCTQALLERSIGQLRGCTLATTVFPDGRAQVAVLGGQLQTGQIRLMLVELGNSRVFSSSLRRR